MKWLAVCLMMLPSLATAYVSGIDDVDSNLPPNVQKQLDDAITTYYQHPAQEKVLTVLDIMNDSKLLLRKKAWPPVIGFLSVVFKDNKQHLFDWMSLHDYNLYAEDVFVSALLHANLRETALVFAQAHHWRKSDLNQVRYGYDKVDLKHLHIDVPGHIDTLWGAFFGSGDIVYVNEIIDYLLKPEAPRPENVTASEFVNLPIENKKLAETTLKQYAAQHKAVHAAVVARIASEKNEQYRSYLRRIILGQHEKTSESQ